jgi:hypothetical protein
MKSHSSRELIDEMYVRDAKHNARFPMDYYVSGDGVVSTAAKTKRNQKKQRISYTAQGNHAVSLGTSHSLCNFQERILTVLFCAKESIKNEKDKRKEKEIKWERTVQNTHIP